MNLGGFQKIAFFRIFGQKFAKIGKNEQVLSKKQALFIQDVLDTEIVKGGILGLRYTKKLTTDFTDLEPQMS